MSLKYRHKKTGQVAVVTAVQWATSKEKPEDETLMPTACVGFDDVLIHYGYEGQLIPNYTNDRSDFLRTHERVEEKAKFSHGPCLRPMGIGKVTLCSDCPLWKHEEVNRRQ